MACIFRGESMKIQNESLLNFLRHAGVQTIQAMLPKDPVHMSINSFVPTTRRWPGVQRIINHGNWVPFKKSSDDIFPWFHKLNLFAIRKHTDDTTRAKKTLEEGATLIFPE